MDSKGIHGSQTRNELENRSSSRPLTGVSSLQRTNDEFPENDAGKPVTKSKPESTFPSEPKVRSVSLVLKQSVRNYTEERIKERIQDAILASVRCRP